MLGHEIVELNKLLIEVMDIIESTYWEGALHSQMLGAIDVTVSARNGHIKHFINAVLNENKH